MPPQSTETVRLREPLLVELRARITRMEMGSLPQTLSGGPISSGITALDRILPEGGFRRGTLIEWLSPEGGAAGLLALLTARAACGEGGGALVVLDPDAEFHPPAVARWGIHPKQLIVLQPASWADRLWAMDQAMRCSAVGATWAWLDKRLSDRDCRRLQLAVEQGGGLGLFVRPEEAVKTPCWADVRLAVEPNGEASHFKTESPGQQGLILRVVHARGGGAGRRIGVVIDEETCAVRLASELVDSTSYRRETGT